MNFTNHLGKRRKEPEIMSRTGHRSKIAVRKYKRSNFGTVNVIKMNESENRDTVDKIISAIENVVLPNILKISF